VIPTRILTSDPAFRQSLLERAGRRSERPGADATRPTPHATLAVIVAPEAVKAMSPEDIRPCVWVS
jgi:hypothetical protein